MRIVSLLPSLTELVCALGRGADLVGVSHLCDAPAEVRSLPPLTSDRYPADSSSAEVDAWASAHKGSLYTLDEERLASLAPDLILTQEQCEVCAVDVRLVRAVADRLPGRPRVESVDPHDLAEVLAMFRRIGDLIGAGSEAEALVGRFEATSAEVARRLSDSRADTESRPRVLLLEWVDPPYSAGHWSPDLIERAGGVEVLGRSGERSTRVTWNAIVAARPDVVIIAACGFALERAVEDLPILQNLEEWRTLPAVRHGRVAIVDGSLHFNRPGPRIEEALRIASSILHPQRCGDLAPSEGWRFVDGI